MATPAECIAALQAHLGGAPNFTGQLQTSKGYAFQAFVFDSVGAYLCQFNQWTWHHPNNTPTFARAAGATAYYSTTALSGCRHIGGERYFLQELTILGMSGAPHNLDAAHVRLPPTPAWPNEFLPPSDAVAIGLECKNVGAKISMDIAREVVGLGADVIFGYGRPRRSRLALVASEDLTANALAMVEAFGHAAVERAAPTHPNGWAHWLGRRVRYA